MLARTIGFGADALDDAAPPVSWRAAGALWLGFALLGWAPLAALAAALL